MRNVRAGAIYLGELFNFLLREQNTEKMLDAMELSFRWVDRMIRGSRSDSDEVANDAIAEVNARFRENGVGYEYANGDIVRVDSQFLHAEAVKPTLELLQEPQYKGAESEFLNAHEHYRHGRFKEALNESLKSLESVMKSICAKRGWPRDQNAQPKALLQVLFDNGLITPLTASPILFLGRAARR